MDIIDAIENSMDIMASSVSKKSVHSMPKPRCGQASSWRSMHSITKLVTSTIVDATLEGNIAGKWFNQILPIVVILSVLVY